MEGSAMDIPVLRVKDLQWRISLRPKYQRLMVRWLAFLVFLMVCPRVFVLYLLILML
jgi:hypothetical protein